MPFSVRGNKNDGYRLYNLDKKSFAKRTFKTREAAENMKKTYMKYDSRMKKSTKKKKSKY
jgi:hypothetical protein